MNVAEAHPLPRIPKYDVVEEIGHGGMATVYRAVDLRLGREVAVKIIHRHLRESLEVGRRFTAEARAVAMLRHPNIVEIYDVSDDDIAERYLVAELVRGKSLRRVLEQEKDLPAEIAACVGVQIAAGLAHAHERGVVHRDVKPENVLFGFGDGEPKSVIVKITDFGIAKLLDQQGVTATGQVLGSPAYMAPEQIECGDVDARADVFSLGVLLYECMVGHLPFEGKNPAQVLRRVLDGAFAPADQEVQTVGSAWAAIVARALGHTPDQRFPGMIELEQALTAELLALGIDDPSAELCRFFADPAAYRAELGGRLGPRLLARGREALAREDVVAAAGCLNRALAFSPGDAAILAQVANLTRRGQRRVIVRRAGMAVLALGVLGGAAGLTSRLTHRPTDANAPPSAVPVATSAPAISGDPSARVAPAPPSSSGAPVVATPRVIVQPPHGPTPPPRPVGERRVRFVVQPPSALLSIDGGPPEPAFGLVRMLPVGVHTFALSVESGNNCCAKGDPQGRAVEAAPEGTPDAEQVIRVSLPLRDATVLSVGPEAAQVRCPTLNVAGPASGSYPVRMNQLSETADCTLYDGGREVARKTITVGAGKATTLAWNAAAP
jgi:serine/threonine-protein kinase